MSHDGSPARLPDDDTAPSYVGETVVGTCSNCGRVAHVPAWAIGSEGYCTGCEATVEWRR